MAGTVLDDHAVTAGRADALDERGRDDEEACFVDVRRALLRFRHDALQRDSELAPFLERLQRHVSGGGVRRLCLGCTVEPREHHRSLDAGDRKDARSDLAHHRVGPLERRSRRQLDHRQEVALVLCRDEAARRDPEQSDGGRDKARVGEHHSFGHRHEPPGQPRISFAEPHEPAIEPVACGDEECGHSVTWLRIF